MRDKMLEKIIAYTKEIDPRYWHEVQLRVLSQTEWEWRIAMILIAAGIIALGLTVFFHMTSNELIWPTVFLTIIFLAIGIILAVSYSYSDRDIDIRTLQQYVIDLTESR